MFLQHRLIADLPRIPGVAPSTAKFVVEQVVERLLAVPAGLEPLMLLQRDEGLLRRSTAIAVLAVVLARAAGWPVSSLPDLGGAALLADLGTILDEGCPGTAAFAWLIERGVDDFWLRSALVARHARMTAASDTSRHQELGAVTIVSLAAAVHAAQQRSGAMAQWLTELRADAANAFPSELLAIVPQALRGS